jgi:hypothetical protein
MGHIIARVSKSAPNFIVTKYCSTRTRVLVQSVTTKSLLLYFHCIFFAVFHLIICAHIIVRVGEAARGAKIHQHQPRATPFVIFRAVLAARRLQCRDRMRIIA